MSKRQHGNREPKKPKKAQSAAKPLSPSGVVPAPTNVAPNRFKKK